MWVIDSREPEEMLKYFTKLNYSVKVLDVGDYVYKDVGFERKEDDFVNAKDVIAKTSELMLTYPYHYLIVTSNLNWLIARANKITGRNITHQILGLVASLAVRGTPPIFTSNKYFGAYVMQKIAEKTYDNKVRIPEAEIRKIRTRATVRDWQINVLLGLPGVGYERAKRLIEHFGSIEAVVDASMEELMEVEGIGKEMAKKIWEVLHLQGGVEYGRSR